MNLILTVYIMHNKNIFNEMMQIIIETNHRKWKLRWIQGMFPNFEWKFNNYLAGTAIHHFRRIQTSYIDWFHLQTHFISLAVAEDQTLLQDNAFCLVTLNEVSIGWAFWVIELIRCKIHIGMAWDLDFLKAYWQHQ